MTLFQDLRYAVRQLSKSPGFTIAAVLTIAFGIGANTAIFSSMDAVVMRPLTVPRMDRVVTVGEEREKAVWWQLSALGNYEDWVRQSHSFEQTGVLTSLDMSMTGSGDATHVRAARNSGSFFSVLKAQPLMGRVFTDKECLPGSDNAAVLNYGFWQERFGGDARIVGRRIELDQREYTIVGVMAKTLQYPAEVDVFIPLAATAQQMNNRTDRDYLVIARLRDGVTVKQAQAEMRIIGDGLAKAYPATDRGWSVKVETLLEGINGPFTPLFYRLLMGATLFVLLVVCANIANLQFARGLARRPEIAMRTALGASRARVMQQLLTENILLGVMGALAGLLFAWAYLHIILTTMPARIAHYMSGWSNTSLNGRALAFSLLLAVVVGVVSGFAPALESMRMNLVDQLKSGSRTSTGSGRTHRLRNILAVAQISLAVALVIGAVLMSKGMTALLHVADSYKPEKTLTFRVTLPETRYGDLQKRAAWYTDSLAKLRALPGVKRAELTGTLPYSDSGWAQDTAIENRPLAPGAFQSALRITVSDGYFSAFHIRLIDGRGFAPGDVVGAQPVAVVSRRFVERYFPTQNPLGQHIRMGVDPANQTPWLTIVGVVDEANYGLWDTRIQPAVYLSAAQVPNPDTTYTLMTDGDPMALVVPARKALAGLDPALPLDTVETWQQLGHDQLIGVMNAAGWMGVDGLIALLLATIGIFGVMANLVGERTREIGVRLAMGARREDVLRMMLRRAGWLTATGVGIGLVMAFALARGVANLLKGVRPDDPLVFSSITLAIIAITLVASWIPARRAAAVEPMAALRDE